MTQGRKRSAKNLPAHIKDPTKLPTGVWYSAGGNGRWMIKYLDLANGKYKSERLCGPDATLHEIWRAVDQRQPKHILTLKTLSLEFQSTSIWRKLSPLTQRDYLDCHQHICAQQTATGPFGDVAIEKITVGTVRKYRDHRAESSESRANKEFSYLSRVFSWAYEYEKVKTNPCKGIRKLYIKPRQHYAEDKDYEFLLQVAKESGYWYMPYAMEIAYLCRMRLSEVIDLTDADETPDGLLIRRRKGSKDNITLWNDRLKTAWTEARAKRDQISKERRLALPINPTDRPLFLSERTGDKIVISSLKTAKARIDTQAKTKAEQLGIIYNHFTFHDLKRKGVTDTEGNKQEASGHRNASMLAIYDVKPAKVKPAKD